MNEEMIVLNQGSNDEIGCDKKERKKRTKKKVIVGVIALLCIVISIGIISINEVKYNNAMQLLAEKEYLKSYNILKELKQYKNSEEVIENFRFVPKETKHYETGGEADITHYTYNAAENKLKVTNNPQRLYDMEYVFNNNGDCIEVTQWGNTRKISYDAQGRCVSVSDSDSREEFKYDNNGNLVKETFCSDYSVQTTEYTYDKNSNCIRKKWEHSSYGIFTTEYTYDEKGNCIKEEVFDEEKKYVELIKEYVYDEKGNCIGIYNPNTDNIFENYPYVVHYGGRFTYDENGYSKSETITRFNCNSSFTKYIYDKNGKCIKESLLKSGGWQDEINYTYDKKGNCIEEVKYCFSPVAETYIEKKTKYTYDEKGNCIKEVRKDGDTIEYTFDDNGNCIKKVETSSSGSYTTEYKDYFIIYARQSLDSLRVPYDI